ncbi:BadF/BadG/BcrA/BcrD ATPase family protein [Streptomyces sp. B8F3]|uniref:N-acetylglucosamine kinase n=1 Tax=Streptomyces sp. B8F3 TaxID=3153573 RepID=UPI00325E7C39
MEKLVIGIDVGGTRIRAALARSAGGGMLRTASAGAGNPRAVPPEVLASRLTACLAPLAEAAGPGRVASVVAGVAGAEPRNPDDTGTRAAYAALRTALRRGGMGPVPVQVRGDTEIAFAAGPGAPSSGVVAIAGTGAAAARITARRQTRTIDGHGWLLGDEGSGFWIARQALRAALRSLDGRGPATALVGLLTEATGGGGPGTRGESAEASTPAGGADEAAADPGVGRLRERDPAAGPRGSAGDPVVRIALVDAGFAGAPVEIARLCPVVVRAAEAGDAVAAAILDEAADHLAETVSVLTPAPGEPLVTTGALLAPAGPLLSRFTARMRAYDVTPAPVPDGLAGAVALARALP